jgi:hypothetical protein
LKKYVNGIKITTGDRLKNISGGFTPVLGPLFFAAILTNIHKIGTKDASRI